MEYIEVQSWPVVTVFTFIVFSACFFFTFSFGFLNWPLVGLLALEGRVIPLAAL